ncbi:fimbria/pilus outer membrane usher protein [Candidimonas nitroreducens]|uniref:fimbria/pilus outer membrane usher protein n=1 Tax=Candidimonas nitroreducens TaxID=683354 RepID=UPI001303375E|nr:fimbria/pilus outer membrane usher protein [Candidimonas nitroreducens]
MAPPASGSIVMEPGSGSLASQQLYLQVYLNGNKIEALQPFTLRGGTLWAEPAVLRRIGFKNPGPGVESVQIDKLPDTRVRYDAGQQQLDITAPLGELNLARTVTDVDAVGALQVSAGTGMLLNYDLYGTYTPSGASTLSASTELRAFSPLGTFSNTMWTRYGPYADDLSGGVVGQANRWDNVRLDTSWSTSWPGKALTLTLGDTTTSYVSWSRATRIGGIRFGRNFSLQPYKITSPLPAFLGSATLPSAVDLYIDGVKRYTGVVPAGPFQINTPPNITGLGNAQMVLTDAQGRRTQVDIPFYAATTRLARGLSDWSVEAGYVRKDYGLSSFSYAGEPMFSGTARYGLSQNLTLEAHGEQTRGLALAGGGAVLGLGLAGQMQGSYTASRGGGLSGSQYSLGYQWQSRYFNVGFSTTHADMAYRDVAALYGTPVAQEVQSAVIGTFLGRAGAVNLNYVGSRYAGSDSNRYAGVSWSKTFGDSVTLSVNYNRNLNAPHDQAFYVGLNIWLDKGLNVSSSLQHANGQTGYGLGASQTAPGYTGWNWTVQGQHMPDATYGYAQAGYRGKYGEYMAGVSTSNSTNSAYGDVSGSVALMGGGVFAGRKITDSFAVVSTDRVPDVPVRLQNNPVGKTDARGLLMVMPLMSYQKNLISIDTLDLPADVKIDRVSADVVPQVGAGALVKFSIEPARAATVILHDTAGRPLPVGSTVRLNGAAATSMLGYDGMAYLEGLLAHDRVQVTTGDGRSCSAAFDYRHVAGKMATIGPLRCE